MVSSNNSRLYVGLLIVVVTLFSYLLNFDLIFLFSLLIFITYDFFYIKIINTFFLIFLLLLSFVFFLIVSTHILENLFLLQLIIILGILFLNKYKKELFVLSLYIFCIILFYIMNSDRNLFYLIFFVSFFNDTVAYVSGRYLGGPRIVPKVSPNKTWSGTSISFLLTTLLLYSLNFNILISMVLSISIFFGDIFFSFIKRFLNLKDFSPLLGSHGGILDRLDSMFFVTIIFQINFVYLS